MQHIDVDVASEHATHAALRRRIESSARAARMRPNPTKHSRTCMCIHVFDSFHEEEHTALRFEAAFASAFSLCAHEDLSVVVNSTIIWNHDLWFYLNGVLSKENLKLHFSKREPVCQHKFMLTNVFSENAQPNHLNLYVILISHTHRT